jgi:hypothetical protein
MRGTAMNMSLRYGAIAFGFAALLGIGSAASAAPAGTQPAALKAAIEDSVTDVRYRRGRHWRSGRYWRGGRGYARPYRGGYRRYAFRGGHSPYGCYYDEGGGRFYSCDAGGWR